MARLSVVVICFNEEAILGECLSAVPWADEIVVLDSFSTDRSLQIARRYGAKVFQHAWQGYARQKTLALREASHPWVLSLDADEVVSPELAEEIRSTLSRDPDLAGYRIPRMTRYLGRFLRHCWYPDLKVRLFQKALGRWGEQDVHETVLLDGPCGRLRHPLLHYSFPSIREHLETIQRYTGLSAASLARSGRPFSLARLLGSPLFMFLQQYVGKRGFLDGVPGLVASVLSAFHEFVKYAKLYELTRNGGEIPPGQM
jgi:glycosyltransferase involved in cell wall biosynthesis